MARPTAEDRRRDYLAIGAEIVTKFSAEESRAGDRRRARQRQGRRRGRPGGRHQGRGVPRLALAGGVPQGPARSGCWSRTGRPASASSTSSWPTPTCCEADPRTIMLRYADFVFDALKDDPAFFARFSFFVYAAEPRGRRAAGAAATTRSIEDFGPVVEQYLELIGRRVRAPFTTALMLISINSLFQGLCLRYRTSPELVEQPGRTRRGSSMYAARPGVDRDALQRAGPDRGRHRRGRPRVTGPAQVGQIVAERSARRSSRSPAASWMTVPGGNTATAPAASSSS